MDAWIIIHSTLVSVENCEFNFLYAFAEARGKTQPYRSFMLLWEVLSYVFEYVTVWKSKQTMTGHHS